MTEKERAKTKRAIAYANFMRYSNADHKRAIDVRTTLKNVMNENRMTCRHLCIYANEQTLGVVASDMSAAAKVRLKAIVEEQFCDILTYVKETDHKIWFACAYAEEV